MIPELLVEMSARFNEYAKLNPAIAGAISLAAMGALAYVARNLPSKVFSLIKNQLVTTLVLDNTPEGMSSGAFDHLQRWIESSPYVGLNRSMRGYSRWEQPEEDGPSIKRLKVGMGEMPMIVPWENSICWVTRNRVQGNGPSNSLNAPSILWEITITRLGRDRDSLKRLLYKFEKEYASDHSVKPMPRIWRFVFSSDGGSWDDPREFQPRSLKSVIIGGGVKEKLLSVIDKFSKSEDWYVERGFPYQLGIMLKGFPGCGKTSLIRALATELQRDIYPISLPSISDNALIAAIRLAPKKSLIVMEDFNVAALKARNADLSVNAGLLPKEDSSNQVSFLSLHGFLQAMDGLDTGGGKIIFMTTNVYDELDAAVTRPGRIDYTFDLEKLSSDDVKDYIRLMYPESVIPDVTFKTISGAELQSIYLDHHDSEKSFINAIPKE